MKHRGNRPKHGALIAEIGAWELYELPGTDDSQWRQLKLVHSSTVEAKANYWLGWNGARLSRSRDAAALEKHRPALLAEIVARLQAIEQDEVAA